MIDSASDTVPVAYLVNDSHYQSTIPSLRLVVDRDGYMRRVKSHRARIAPKMRFALYVAAVAMFPFLAIVTDYV